MILYLTEKLAKEYGMTHHGRMFGLPAYVKVSGENEITGSPKLPFLWIWCFAIDWLMEQALWFIDEDVQVVTPISVGRPIP